MTWSVSGGALNAAVAHCSHNYKYITLYILVTITLSVFNTTTQLKEYWNLTQYVQMSTFVLHAVHCNMLYALKQVNTDGFKYVVGLVLKKCVLYCEYR